VVRRKGILDYLRPDGKSQVTVEYDDGKPVAVRGVVLAAQHHPDVSDKQLRDDLIEKVIEQVVPAEYMDKDNIRYYINETGRFVIGGPQGDCGLTGRKIIVDTYGGVGSHGGGCFSGKDPTKVDRSGSYMARHIAKNIVAADLAYAIGVVEPVSVMVDTHGTGKIDDAELARVITKTFDLRPRAIIETLKLQRPIFRRTATYGHFGREEEGFTWEVTDRVEDLKKNV
jgi:S-adenosylmethionine synthetase